MFILFLKFSPFISSLKHMGQYRCLELLIRKAVSELPGMHVFCILTSVTLPQREWATEGESGLDKILERLLINDDI